MRWVLLLAVLLVATPTFGQISIEKPWARAAAARVELHVVSREGEVMKMREVSGYDVPANGAFELKPGGAHLMFREIKRPFREGEKVQVMLRFEKAGEVSAEFHVGRLGDTAPPVHHKR